MNIKSISQFEELKHMNELLLQQVEELKKANVMLLQQGLQSEKEKVAEIVQRNNDLQKEKDGIATSRFIDVHVNAETGKETVKYDHTGQAEEIINEIPLLHTNNGFFYYDADLGIWKDNAERYLKKYVTKKLGQYHKIQRIKETVDYISAKTYEDTKIDKFEKNPYLVNLKNGVFDLETGEFIIHNPMYYQKIQIPIEYNPNATCPKFDKFLNDTVGAEQIQFVYEWFGYHLVKAYPIAAMLILQGEGGNGKSILLKILQTFVGKENVSNIPLQKLQENTFASSRLYMKSANIYADIGSNFMSQLSTIKALTGGDSTDAEAKGKTGFDFDNTAKLTYSANKLPPFADTTNGGARRLIVLPMDNEFKGDNQENNLVEKIATDEELSGILNKSIQAIMNVLSGKTKTERSPFSMSPKMIAATDKWIMEMDNVKLFVYEECNLNENAKINPDELYRYYKQYCSDNDFKPLGNRLFKAELLKKFPSLVIDQREGRNDRSRYIYGLGYYSK